MANLYLTEQNSILRKSGDRLIVQKGEEILLDVQCHKIDAVLVFGNVQFTTQAVHELFKHGIEMALLTRTGRLVGQITSPFTKNIELRIEQFRRHGDNAFKLGLSKAVVKGKIGNCITLMKSFSYNHSEIILEGEMSAMEAAMKSAEGADGIATLRGFEGNAARAYFEGFGKMILG